MDDLSPTAALESRIGVQPLDEIIQEHQHIVNQVADLRARFGSFGTFDHLRKVELSRIKGLIRAQATRDKRRVNNDQIDEEAHAHPDYIEFVTKATTERARWVKLESELEEIEWRVNRGQMLGRFSAVELTMTPRQP